VYRSGGLEGIGRPVSGGDLPTLTGGVARGVPRRASWRESDGIIPGFGGVGPSSRRRQGAQFDQSAIHLVLPGPAPGQVQDDSTSLAGDPSGQGEEALAEGLGGDRLLAQAGEMFRARGQHGFPRSYMGNIIPDPAGYQAAPTRCRHRSDRTADRR